MASQVDRVLKKESGTGLHQSGIKYRTGTGTLYCCCASCTQNIAYSFGYPNIGNLSLIWKDSSLTKILPWLEGLSYRKHLSRLGIYCLVLADWCMRSIYKVNAHRFLFHWTSILFVYHVNSTVFINLLCCSKQEFQCSVLVRMTIKHSWLFSPRGRWNKHEMA